MTDSSPFEPIGHESIAEAVVEQIETMIVDGILKEGRKLPSERELAEVMRRLMLQEQLPSRQGYGLGLASKRIIREALQSNRKRGMEIVKGIEGEFPKGAVAFYHKPGFSENWMSDVIYVYRYNSRRRWIVVMAGYPGREALNGAARAVGRVLARDGLQPQ